MCSLIYASLWFWGPRTCWYLTTWALHKLSCGNLTPTIRGRLANDDSNNKKNNNSRGQSSNGEKSTTMMTMTVMTRGHNNTEPQQVAIMQCE